jgi:hypothetical protein
MAEFVEYYNTGRLRSAVCYVAPQSPRLRDEKTAALMLHRASFRASWTTLGMESALLHFRVPQARAALVAQAG